MTLLPAYPIALSESSLPRVVVLEVGSCLLAGLDTFPFAARGREVVGTEDGNMFANSIAPAFDHAVVGWTMRKGCGMWPDRTMDTDRHIAMLGD